MDDVTQDNAINAGSVRIVRGSDPEKAVFFFSAMGLRGVPFHFVDISQGATYSKVFVRDVFDVWYHKGLHGHTSSIDETTDFLSDMIDEQGFKRIVFVGTSAGGFAAILFGTRVGANVVHAFSSRTFLDVGKRLRYGDLRTRRSLLRLYSLRTSNKVLDLKPILLEAVGATKYFIHFCSGSRLDRIHSSRLAQSSRVKLYAHPCGDHRVGKYLKDQKVLSKILEVEEFEHIQQILRH